MDTTLTSDCTWLDTPKGHGQSYYNKHGIFTSRTDTTVMEEIVVTTPVHNLLTDEKTSVSILMQEGVLMVQDANLITDVGFVGNSVMEPSIADVLSTRIQMIIMTNMRDMTGIMTEG